MFNQILLLIYRLFLHGGRRKINWMEKYLDYDGRTELSPDDVKNEPKAYEALFSIEHRPSLEQLYLILMNEMSGAPYQRCGDVIEALAFIQEIAATALWKYRQNVGATVEEFVRDFDRLDVPDERVRLYEKAQGQ